VVEIKTKLINHLLGHEGPVRLAVPCTGGRSVHLGVAAPPLVTLSRYHRWVCALSNFGLEMGGVTVVLTTDPDDGRWHGDPRSNVVEILGLVFILGIEEEGAVAWFTIVLSVVQSF
jgi:hypothetical protein